MASTDEMEDEPEVNPVVLLLSTAFKVVALVATPFLFLAFYIMLFNWFHSGLVFYSSVWGPELIIMPPGDTSYLILADFYFQIFVEHGAAIIVAAALCMPIVMMFFPNHGFSVSLAFAIVGTFMLWTTDWPMANIPRFMGSYLSPWIVALELTLLPLCVFGVANMIRRKIRSEIDNQ